MNSVKERPILFSAPMIRALLDGRKTATRRVVKPQYVDGPGSVKSATNPHYEDHSHDWWLPTGTQPYSALPRCLYGKPGDRLWVREAWAADAQLDTIAPRGLSRSEPIWYPANGATGQTGCAMICKGRIRPSLHMPRWASRMLLEITNVRVERLQDISQCDIRAEGLQCPTELASDDVSPNYRDWYLAVWREQWSLINGAESWDANPWVWVIEFKPLMEGPGHAPAL